ncbi:MAG: Uma2 family endonuclease [Chloroflexi bacterium]|nr:Uma2 family endonuclease [Chloroflexota bacterium]
MAASTQVRISAEAYYQLAAYQDQTLIQLIDGEVVIGAAPIVRHQRVVRELLIVIALIARKTGGEAFGAPTEVYLDAFNVVEPDVLYLKPEYRDRIQEKRIVGPPDLVVKVLSPSTAKHDRVQKVQASQPDRGVRADRRQLQAARYLRR